MDTIVVGYDGSPASERALDRAAELGEAMKARLVVVSVERSPRASAAVPVPRAETLLIPSAVGGAIPPAASLAEPELRQPVPKDIARRQLEQARMSLARRHVDAEYVAEVGDPADRLLEIVEERGGDLLVVGSREHGLLDRLLARPVDEAVARRAPRDVLLVH